MPNPATTPLGTWAHNGMPSESELRRRPDAAGTTTKYWLEALLRGAGHDPHDPIDPVSVTWQRIWTDPSPPDTAPDWVWEDDSIRVGPIFYESIDYVLAPRWALAFCRPPEAVTKVGPTRASQARPDTAPGPAAAARPPETDRPGQGGHAGAGSLAAARRASSVA